jgi:SagB-type dehydrogenase family enzyme
MSGHIGREFMEKTRHVYLPPSDQQRGSPQPPLTRMLDEGAGRIELPRPENGEAGPGGFLELVTQRTSLRTFAPTPISVAELSFLLWCTQGIKEVVPGAATFRTVPSAGARYAFETLLAAHRVEGLDGGVYQYDSLEHQLAPRPTVPGFSDQLVRACCDQDFLGRSAVVFLWVAIRERMTWRYGERGYRYLHLDAGHVCQNLYLAAETIRAGACAVAAFDDAALNRLLGLDGHDEFVIYLAAVGKRKQTPP